MHVISSADMLLSLTSGLTSGMLLLDSDRLRMFERQGRKKQNTSGHIGRWSVKILSIHPSYRRGGL